MKVRLKREIVTMGEPDIRPSEQAGEYVEPEDWNKLISDPDVLVVDTRNSYETAIGQFRGATDPQTTTFREFPAWAKALADKPEEDRPQKNRDVLHRRYQMREINRADEINRL